MLRGGGMVGHPLAPPLWPLLLTLYYTNPEIDHMVVVWLCNIIRAHYVEYVKRCALIP